MDPVECPTHEKALYYCPSCVKLICTLCDPSHVHITKQVDDYEPDEIKNSIATKQKELQELVPKLEEFEKEFAKVKDSPLHFLAKRTGTEVDPKLFIELGSTMDEIRKRSLAIQEKRDKCGSVIVPTLDAFRAELKEVGQLLGSFDVTAKDPQKFLETYKNRSECKELNREELQKDMKDLVSQQGDYRDSMYKVMTILEKYWFEGIPNRLISCQSLDTEMKERLSKLVELRQHQSAWARAADELQSRLSATTKEIDAQTKRGAEVLKEIKAKNIEAQVAQVLEELGKKRTELATVTSSIVEVERRHKTMERENVDLSDMQQRLQRGLIEKTKELKAIEEETRVRRKELDQVADSASLMNQKLDSMILYVKSELDVQQGRYDKMQDSLSDLSSQLEELRADAEEADKALKGKQKDLDQLRDKEKVQHNKLKQNAMALERQKLEIDDYLKSAGTEIAKNSAAVKNTSKTLEEMARKRKEFETWLKDYRSELATTMFSLEKYRKETKQAEKDLGDKQTELRGLAARCQKAGTQLQQLDELYSRHKEKLDSDSEKLRGFTATFAESVKGVQDRVKTLGDQVHQAREAFMRNKCGKCLCATKSTLFLECKHLLCENCAAELFAMDRAFAFSCAICEHKNTKAMRPLRCGCAVELPEFARFVERVKDETHGSLVRYSAYKLEIVPVMCANGHTLPDEELLSFYPEMKVDLEKQRKSMQTLLEQDKAYEKREVVLKAINSNLEAKAWKTKVGNEGIRTLADALPLMKAIETLDLQANKLFDPALHYISSVLPIVGPTLQILDLGRNEIGDEGIKSLARALRRLKSLRKLCLDRNKLTASSGEHLAAVLNSMPLLAYLQLIYNELGPGGATTIAGALASNKSLATLYLSNNMIGDQGAAALGKALAANSGLKELHLQSNMIGTEGLRALAEGLGKNNMLEKIAIRYNKIDPMGEKICEDLAGVKKGKLEITYK